MFDNYKDEFEYPLKEQERSDRAESTAPLQTHIGKLSQEMSQVKNHQESLSNTENKSQLLKKFTVYLTQENTCKDLIGR